MVRSRGGGGEGAAVTYYSIQQQLSIRLRFKLAAGAAEPLAVGVAEPCTRHVLMLLQALVPRLLQGRD